MFAQSIVSELEKWLIKNDRTPLVIRCKANLNYGGQALDVKKSQARPGFSSIYEGCGFYFFRSLFKLFLISLLTYVGIGTSNPLVPLHVAQSGRNVVGNMTLLSTFTDPTE